MNDKHGSNGFLLGLLLGGAVGALVSTKKGRQILKDVADYGVEYVGNAINMEDVETILNEDEEEMMSGEVDQEPSSAKVFDHEAQTESVKEGQAEDAPKRRRLFRGIGKK